MSFAHIRVSVLPILFSILLSSAALAEPAPQLDGFTNDPIWAAEARCWTLTDPAQPEAIGRYYLAYDDLYLYFAADVYDLDVVGSNRSPKSRVWEDDSVRLLLHAGDPLDTHWTDRTFSYTFSAAGGASWNRGPQPETADTTTEPAWPPTWDSAASWAVGLKPGTLPNVTGNRDGGYVVEARIPWSELKLKPPFKPGSTMQVCILNMHRPQMNLPGGKPLSTAQAARELNPPNPSRWERIRMDWPGPLPMRGLVEPLPLWLGSTNTEFEHYKSSETDAQGPWLSREYWTRRLGPMRAQNFNTLLLRHPHPLIGLLAGTSPGHKPDTRPASQPHEAFTRTGWFGPQDYERHRDQLRWLLAEAKKNGVNVYLLLDKADGSQSGSPCSSQPNAQASTAPADPSAISRAVKQLFDLYPDLAGIAAGKGYNSPDILQAMAEALASRRPAQPSKPATTAPAATTTPAGHVGPQLLPLAKTIEPGPELLIWTKGIDPAVARRTIDTYPKTQLLHPLQDGQWLAPLADRGIAEFDSQTTQLHSGPAGEPVRSVAFGSLRGAHNYLLWGDPQWMRNVLLDVRNQGIQGFLLDSGIGPRDLARQAMADYAYNASQQFSPKRWEARLQSLGIGQYAGQLLEALQHASAIVPEVLLLLNDSSGRFMPQFGVPLTHCLHMPSYSPATIGAPNGRGLLITPLGPAWPNPCWHRSVAGISAGNGSSSPTDAVPASEIIANLNKHVQACNAILTSLRHLPPKNPEQAQALGTLLDSIEFNAAVGDYLAIKLQAALGWEQYKARRGRKIDSLEPLGRSTEAFRKAAKLGDRLYSQPVVFWESQIVSAPPWTREFIERHYAWVHGTWADRLPPFERELSVMRESTAAEGSRVALPLWDVLNATSPDKRQTRVVIDFEKPDQRYHLSAGASLTDKRELRLSGERALLVDTRELPPGFHEVLTTDVGTVPLTGYVRYEVVLAYRVIDPGPSKSSDAAEPFEIGFRHSLDRKPMGDHRCWTAPKDRGGLRVLQVPAPDRDGNVFYIATRAPAAIIIDHIQISQIVE